LANIGPNPALVLSNLSVSKVFMVDSATLVLNLDPGTLPDALLQMAVNKIFIPLPMLTTCALNWIKMNQDVKYKHLTYGPGMGKTFLDESSFSSEDKLSDF